MGNKDWSDDEIREAIKDAHRIFMEDHGNRALYEKLHSQYGTQNDPNKPGGAPPPKDPPQDPPADKPKRSLWWGETE